MRKNSDTELLPGKEGREEKEGRKEEKKKMRTDWRKEASVVV